MHIWVDANNPVAYIATGYRDGHYGSVYKMLDFENALRDIGAIDDYKRGRFVFPARMLKKCVSWRGKSSRRTLSQTPRA